MTFQHRDMERSEAGGFRKLSVDEIGAVAGGGDSYDFTLLDANSDGAVTEMEVAAIHGAWTPFDFSEADADKDGVLSKAEMANLIVVTAPQWWYGLSSGLSGGYSGYSGGDAEEWYSGGGGGGDEDGEPAPHACANAAANEAATATNALPASGTIEFLSVVYLGSDGNIHTSPPLRGESDNVSREIMEEWMTENDVTYDDLRGVVHNHPAGQSGGDSFDDERSRYPSLGDWGFADGTIAAGADPDQFSMYIISSNGDLREFEYSDVSTYTVPADQANAATDIDYYLDTVAGINLPPTVSESGDCNH